MYTDFYDQDYSTMATSSLHGPLRVSHDLAAMFPDTDSGFGSYKARSTHLATEDFSPPPSRLVRSSSLTRLNGICDLNTSLTSENLERTMHNLQNALEDSETRRNVLVDKLKEAQATLQLQNDRLSKLENAASDNTAMVEDLKFKEREYRLKITQLQRAEEEKQTLQMENVRLRQEMQARIDTLDWQLNSLKSQHYTVEHENSHRSSLLDHTTQALSLLEQENTKFQKECDRLRNELAVMREACELSKTRAQAVEGESKSHRLEADKLRQENMGMTGRIQEMAGQMTELRSLLQAVKDDNERLSSSWKLSSEDKHRFSRKAEEYQETVADLKSRLAAVTADKDRLFLDCMDLNRRLQQLTLEKEKLLKTKMCLEEQLSEQTYSSRPFPRHSEKKEMEEELAAVKKVSEELSSELTTVKAFYERALEQLSAAESSRRLQQQHLDLAQQEVQRLRQEVDRLSQSLADHHSDDQQEWQHLEDTLLKTRSELKDAKYENDQLSSRIHELETKLLKANEGIRGGLDHWQEEMETWKVTCDRLTGSVSRKESDIKVLTDRCHNLEQQLSRVQEELRQSKEKCEIAIDAAEEVKKLREEKRRLLQEKAENEQMLQLLETQRDVLSRNTENSLSRAKEVERLSGTADQLRSENDLLRQRIAELEKMRDSLISQKEELLASSELVYKTQEMEDLEDKMQELRSANKQLRGLNENMTDKLQILEQENLRLKRAMGETPNKEEVRSLQEENRQLKGEVTNLRQQKQRLTSESRSAKQSPDLQKLQRERDALQKQVQLVSGQLSLVEGSKRRVDESLQQAQEELRKAQTELKASQKECAEARRVSSQVKVLSEQLQLAKAKQESQEKLIHSMKKEAVEDAAIELQQMRVEVRKLTEDTETKQATIEALQTQLRTACNTAEIKERAVSDLRKLISELEQQNALYTSGSQDLVSTAFLLSPATVVKIGEKSLKDELEEAVRIKQVGLRGEVSQHLDDTLIGAASNNKVFSNETGCFGESTDGEISVLTESASDIENATGPGPETPEHEAPSLSHTLQTQTQLIFAKPPYPKGKPRRLPVVQTCSPRDLSPQLGVKAKISNLENRYEVEQWPSAIWSKSEDRSQLDLARSEQPPHFDPATIFEGSRSRQLPVVPQERSSHQTQNSAAAESQHDEKSVRLDELEKPADGHLTAASGAENLTAFENLTDQEDVLPDGSLKLNDLNISDSVQEAGILSLQDVLLHQMENTLAHPDEISIPEIPCVESIADPSLQCSSAIDESNENDSVDMGGSQNLAKDQSTYRQPSSLSSSPVRLSRAKDASTFRKPIKEETNRFRPQDTTPAAGLKVEAGPGRENISILEPRRREGRDVLDMTDNKDRKEFLMHLNQLLENQQTNARRSKIFLGQQLEKKSYKKVVLSKPKVEECKSLHPSDDASMKVVSESDQLDDARPQEQQLCVDVSSSSHLGIGACDYETSSTIDLSPGCLADGHESTKEGQSLKLKPSVSPFLSRSLSQPLSIGANQSAAVASRQAEPEKEGAEGTVRLQSLISKYRSHSTDTLGDASKTAERGARERVSSAPPVLHVPAPKTQVLSTASPRAPLLRPDISLSPRAGRKFPPHPPPKPGKSPTQGGCLSSAEADSGGDVANPLLDSQERSDINALIQKQPGSTASTKPLLSVHPPKITSKVIAALLRSKKLS